MPCDIQPVEFASLANPVVFEWMICYLSIFAVLLKNIDKSCIYINHVLMLLTQNKPKLLMIGELSLGLMP